MHWLIRTRDNIMFQLYIYIAEMLSVFPSRTCYTEEWDDAEDEPLDDVHEGGGHLRVVVVEDQVSIRVHGDLSRAGNQPSLSFSMPLELSQLKIY